VAIAGRLYMDDNNGGMFHHHEGWVLDDGTQTDTLPADAAGCAGGEAGNSQAEKPWVIFFYPYLKNRNAAFCPADRTPRSRLLATDLNSYNGGITSTSDTPPPNSEQAIAQSERLTIESDLLNSIFTHKSARLRCRRRAQWFRDRRRYRKYAESQHHYVFGTKLRGSQCRLTPIKAGFDTIGTAMAPTTSTQMPTSVYLRWPEARFDQYPDRVVRYPLADPPQ
jgi:hypothetical protein